MISAETSLLGIRNKIAKSLMRTFTCRSTFLYGVRYPSLKFTTPNTAIRIVSNYSTILCDEKAPPALPPPPPRHTQNPGNTSHPPSPYPPTVYLLTGLGASSRLPTGRNIGRVSENGPKKIRRRAESSAEFFEK
jgi:hypothetical protein